VRDLCIAGILMKRRYLKLKSIYEEGALSNYNPNQLYLFKGLKQDPPVPDTTVLFHIQRANKEKFADIARLEGLSVTGLLNVLISDYISGKAEILKQAVKKKTGRGNTNLDEIDKAKEFFRKMHPKPVRKVELAKAVGCSQARALIILNILSGVSNDKEKDGAEFVSKDFLVGENDEQNPLTYFISKDKVLGIEP